MLPSAALIALLAALLLFPMLAGAQQATTDEWTNASWRYRVGLDITTNTEMENWPIERTFNFTELLREEGDTGTFDNDSVRVYEYGSDGEVLREVPSQFDPADAYNASTNAVGEVVFTLNGTTPANTTRRFQVYFDSEQHGPKPAPSYATNLSSSFDGENLTVDTTKFTYTIDTRAADNTSGIRRAEDASGNPPISDLDPDNRSVEYLDYTNGTHNFTFNLAGSANVSQGPVRMTVEQRGERDFYTLPGTGDVLMVEKRYRFYNLAGPEGNDITAFVKIDQNITNVGTNATTFTSTPAGALAQDLNRSLFGTQSTFKDDNTTDPFSWSQIVRSGNSYGGVINLKEQGSDYLADARDVGNRRRAGINMSQITLQPGESTAQTSFTSYGTQFGGDGITQFNDVIRMFKNQPTVTESDPQSYDGNVTADTNATVYNRNETVEITANITSDPYSLADSVNATLDRNTSGTSDDVTIPLTNQSGLWIGTYDLNSTSPTGIWTANVTVYTDEDTVLTRNATDFNVTDAYFANLTLSEDVYLAESEQVIANLTLQSIRRDRNITGADVRCSYDGSEVPDGNITELGNGTYQANFTAPSADSYVLYCNGTRDGNLGEDSEPFRTEVSEVLPNVTFDPPSDLLDAVTLTDGQNSTFAANVTVPENGTASDTNLSLALPANWSANTTFQQCGDIVGPDGSCQRSFEAAAPAATDPGTYDLNLTTAWFNPDGTRNTTLDVFQVTVEENPVLAVPERFVNGSVGGGLSRRIGNATVASRGNVNLTNASFACQSGTVCDNFTTSFDPANISTLAPGSNATVNVTVGVPLATDPGNYTGRVNASAVNTSDTFNLTVTVIPTTNVSTSAVPTRLFADNVTLAGNQTLSFDSNATNVGEAFAFDVNKSLSYPTNWTTNTSTSLRCGDLNVTEQCLNTSYTTVPNATDPGNYTVDIVSTWYNPDGTNDTSSFPLTVTVEANPVQRVPTGLLNATIPTTQNETLGDITVESIGNTELSNVSFACDSGVVCENFTTTFDPPNISAVPRGTNDTSAVTVEVPPRFPAGTYNGTVNVSSTGGSDTVLLNVTVPISRSWTVEPASCQTSSDPAVGIACQPLLNNTGNTDVNLTFTPAAVNNTEPEPQNISLGLEESRTFNMTYNVTGEEDQVHNATYNLSAEQDATPQWTYFNVTIFPAVKPTINVTLSELIRQNETNTILANVTATSGFPLDTVAATVNESDGDVIRSEMTRIENYTNDTSLWRLDYPNGTNASGADTITRGTYLANITANDTLGNAAFNATNFTVAADITPRLNALDETYDQGEEGSLNYSLVDVFGDGIGGATVNLSVVGPDGFNIVVEQGSETSPFTTSSGTKTGFLNPRPTFDLPNDATPGIYTVRSNASWDDPVTNRTETADLADEFAVELDGDFEVQWSPGQFWTRGGNFTAYAVVSRDDELEDVDDIRLTILDPNGTVFEQLNRSEFAHPGEGVYRANTIFADDAEKGVYWTRLEVWDEGSKSVRFRSFRIVEPGSGVQFDVNTSLARHEVPQGEYLDFNITMLKKTGEDADAKVTYWVEDGSGTSYYWFSEMIFTPVNETIVIPRNAYIYQNQPTGNYSLEVEVVPTDDAGNNQFRAGQAFRVTEENVTTFPEPEPDFQYQDETVTRTIPEDDGPAPTEPNITILDYPRTINTVRGRTFYQPVVLANTGDTQLENVSLSTTGLPSGWIAVQPAQVGALGTRETATFTVRVSVPSEASLTSYNGTFLATTSTVSTERPVTVTVFPTTVEKIRADIDDLTDRLERIRSDIARLRDQGADTSGAVRIAGELEAELQDAEDALEGGNTSAALQHVANGESLADEAENVISRLESPERRSALDLFPILIGALVLLALVLVAVYYLRIRNVDPLAATRNRIHDITREMRKKDKDKEEKLREEKRKTKRLLDLLETQHEEGVMGDESYQELKRSAEEKLDRINRQLRDT